MNLSSDQRVALAHAQAILEGVGLESSDLESIVSSSRPSSRLSSRSSTPSLTRCSSPSLAVSASRYLPPPARSFTPDEIDQRLYKINPKLSVHRIVIHPPRSIVEYPQTGESDNTGVAHVFPIDPDTFENPKSSFQYSLGDSHGGRPGVRCSLLTNDEGEQVPCTRTYLSCRGLKVCSAHDDKSATNFGHSYTSLEQVRTQLVPAPWVDTAKAEVFMKTLALFCSLNEHGCSFRNTLEFGMAATTDEESDSEFEPTADDSVSRSSMLPPSAATLVNHSRQCRRKQGDSSEKECRGTLVMRRDRSNRYFISCQYRTRTHCAHLILRNLQEYDTDYLCALFKNDAHAIVKYEIAAMQEGYGPRVPCTFTAPPSAQKQVCRMYLHFPLLIIADTPPAHWHRYPDGSLTQGVLLPWVTKCKATFHIYVPNDLHACPRIVVVCRSPHSHVPPAPAKTPPPLVADLHRLLYDMGWRLADATPRRIMLDSGFIHGLRDLLGWESNQSPSLSDLHPSLANLDHLRRLINTVRHTKFPYKTGFEGVAQLVSNLHDNPQRYVRCAETHEIEGMRFQLIVCMSPAMSLQLVHAKRLSIDMSFKRVSGKWEEFEIETWDNRHMRSVVVARAFTTSESADAHRILFTRIFEIAKHDTGVEVSFHYISGRGIQSIVADGHRGQALGLGQFCVTLCRGNQMPCRYQPSRRLCDLGPYDHLRRMYRLCAFHYRRNIHKLRTVVSSNVYNAMQSISSFEEHPDFESTLRVIRGGGKKAKDWLADKLNAGFVIPALYFPRSLMPPEIWKASPTTTNGNEQAHRNINRDGISLTLLGGVMHGQDYDERVNKSINTHLLYGIQTRDGASTHLQRTSRSVSRLALNQRKQHKLPTIHESTHEDTNQEANTSDLILISNPPTSVNMMKTPTYYTPTKPPDTTKYRTYSISTYSTLADALTPGISTTDYQSFTAHTSQTTKHTLDKSDSNNVATSSYSSLAGALGKN
ncbi:hypothetical protein J3R83DRAFT_12681 [Lanmaoa asiatica]|nr:hypothetical protein J3R83DRAFT_12681 [Lanmaoa asiatica]